MIAALQAECQWFFGCDERVNQSRISQRSLTLGKLQWKGDMERVEGIEPSTKAWEAFVLPLNYTRSKRLTLYQMQSCI